MAWLLVVVWAAIAVWAIYATPSPGIAIGLLAAAAGIMSVRPQMHILEKLGWIAILIVLTTTEIRSIRQDRKTSNTEQQKIRTEENNRFDAIAQGLKDSIEKSKGQFDATIGHVDSVLKSAQQASNLAKDSLENLTGGDSVAYLAPQPPTDDGRVPLAIVNAGKYPLTGVTVVVMDATPPHFKVGPTLFVGTLASHVVRRIDLSVNPIPGADPPGIASFEITIYAQNGTTNELLQFRRGKKMFWDYRATVSREVPASRSMMPKYAKAGSDVRGLNLSYGWIEDRQSNPHPKQP